MRKGQRDSIAERLARRTVVDAESGCWVWIGTTNDDGYGLIRVDGRDRRVHRLSYELHGGEIPEGFGLHHRCGRRQCVNPGHLEPITQADHNRLHGAEITHCKHGHEFTPENTRWRPEGGRACRRCASISTAAYKRRKQAAAQSSQHDRAA